MEQNKKTLKALPVIAVALALVLIVVVLITRNPSDTPDAGESTAPLQTEAVRTEPQTQPAEQTEPAEQTAPAQTEQQTEAAQTEPQTQPTEQTVPQQTEEQTRPAEQTEQSVQQEASGVEFPLVLEDGKLEIGNLFQYEGLNPDCGDEDGKDIAAITLKNLSGTYLEKADVVLTLGDGAELRFTVRELPAGKTAMAFSTDNTAVEADAVCTAASCKADWKNGLTPLPGNISVTVDGVAVTVTNHTGRNISELVVYCRCPLDEEYFGGVAYSYTINDLPANESASLEAWDCILGMAEVVRIAVN